MRAYRKRSTSGKRRGATAATAETDRASLYDEVTDRIVAELGAGRVPWVQPWGKAGTGPGLPRNALTGRSYSGVNVLILWGEVIAQGWPSQSWLTFRQAIEAGGCVRKGERGTTVVYADRFVPEGEKQRVEREGGDAKAVPFLKRFTVFNVAQCEGLRSGLAADPAPLPEREIVPVAEAVIAASGVDFRTRAPGRLRPQPAGSRLCSPDRGLAAPLHSRIQTWKISASSTASCRPLSATSTAGSGCSAAASIS